MAETDVGIVSKALGLHGKGPISSFDDGTELSSTCGLLYDNLLENILSMHPWRFAMKKQQLGQLVTAPTNEYTYAYQLPSDMIGGPRAMFDSASVGAHPVKDYEIFGDKAYSDYELMICDYRYRPAEGNFPATFVRLMVLAVAADIGFFVTDNATLADVYYKRAYGTPEMNGRGGQFLIAATENDQQQGSEIELDFPLTDIR